MPLFSSDAVAIVARTDSIRAIAKISDAIILNSSKSCPRKGGNKNLFIFQISNTLLLIVGYFAAGLALSSKAFYLR
jgi:hypothetical protein